MHSVSFENIPGFNSFFKSIVENNSLANSLFPVRELHAEHIARRIKSFTYWPQLLRSISASMACIDSLHPSQLSSLELISNQNAACIITGQQSGFLGGPVYTLLKAHTAIAQAAALSASTGMNIVPVFWIEDNDHDAREAGTAYLPGAQADLHTFSTASAENNYTPTSELVYDQSIEEILQQIEQILPHSEFKQDIIHNLQSTYTPGQNWSDAFILYLQHRLADTGILFYKASTARKNGDFAPVLHLNASKPMQLELSVTQRIQWLEQHQLPIQAIPSGLNMFYHAPDGKRHKVKFTENNLISAGDQLLDAAGLQTLVQAEPYNFSPSVLLRPLVQDFVLPGLSYIAGPGETAYMAQLQLAYQSFDIYQPTVQVRHSATFLLPATQRFLQKQNLDPEFFLKPLAAIESFFTDSLRDEQSEKAYQQAMETMQKAAGIIAQMAAGTDASLQGAAQSAWHQTEKQYDTLWKKVYAARKKKNEQLFSKLREISVQLFPGASLQERVLSSIYFENKTGIAGFNKILRHIANNRADMHFFVGLNQENELSLQESA
jgi:bacillithiol biosynthesis cysteine-adding enzyme BshC